MAWEVETTNEYDVWFMEQNDDNQASIRMRVELLKELRTQTENHVFRVAFIFDEKRNAVLLIGGDKKGKDEKRFYQDLIKQAEAIYRQYKKRK